MEIETPNNGNLKIDRSPSPAKARKGSECRQQQPFEGDVQAMKNTPQNDKSLSEWAKKMSTECSDTLKYMLESSGELHRVIAKRIILKSGGD